MMQTASYLLTTTTPQQTAGIARRITPFHRFRRRLPCENHLRKSTGKELDRETGLYYFGARYLDPRTSRWLSVDPAIIDFVPQIGQEPSDLRGLGGVFNIINLHVYNYASNNPLRYIDPNGEWVIRVGISGGAHFGAGSQGSIGIAFGYSRDKGFSFGVYTSGGAIGGIPPSAGIGITLAFHSNADHVRDIAGDSTSRGASGAIGKGFSVDIATDEAGSFDPSSEVSVTFGLRGTPTVVGLHEAESRTVTASTSIPEIMQAGGEVFQRIRNNFRDKILEQVPSW